MNAGKSKEIAFWASSVLLLIAVLTLAGCANNADSRVDKLVEDLKYGGSPNVRAGAARALGEIKDARAVEPLIATLRDEKNWGVLHSTAEALGKIKDARAVEPLIAAMKDGDGGVDSYAAEALARIGEPAVEPLIAALKDENYWGVRGAAEALARIGEPAETALFEELDSGNIVVVARAYDFFIKAGRAGTENTLVKALEEHGGEAMAVAFLNSGNDKLDEAARSWANAGGYTITTMTTYSEHSGPRWGEK